MALLERLLPRYQLAVTVFSAGHPYEVFGTDKVSNHSRGKAMDIWRVNGVPVVERASHADVARLLKDARRGGAREIGAPFDPDGRGGVFSDELHADHVHLSG